MENKDTITFIQFTIFYISALYIYALLPFTFDQKMSLSLDSGSPP